MALYGNNDANYFVVSGTQAGTITIKPSGNLPNPSSGHIYNVYVGVASTGTVTYWDGPPTSGTQICVVANNGTKIPDCFNFQWRVTNGLYAVLSAGTTNQTVGWD